MNTKLEPIYTKIGVVIKQLREESCLTQQELASICGLTRASIANIEAGKQRVLLHTLMYISEALNANVFHTIMIPLSRESNKGNMAISRWRNKAQIAENKIKSIRKVLNNK